MDPLTIRFNQNQPTMEISLAIRRQSRASEDDDRGTTARPSERSTRVRCCGSARRPAPATRRDRYRHHGSHRRRSPPPRRHGISRGGTQGAYGREHRAAAGCRGPRRRGVLADPILTQRVRDWATENRTLEASLTPLRRPTMDEAYRRVRDLLVAAAGKPG